MGGAWSPPLEVKQNALLVTLGTSFQKERKRAQTVSLHQRWEQQCLHLSHMYLISHVSLRVPKACVCAGSPPGHSVQSGFAFILFLQTLETE